MIVVDASVIGKLIFPREEGRELVKSIFQRHLNRTQEIVVPDILFYELGNALATKTSVTQNIMNNVLTRLYNFSLNVCHFGEEDIKRASQFAKSCEVSVYDASYAVLAQEKKCDLITADEKFVEKVNLSFVKSLSDYTS